MFDFQRKDETYETDLTIIEMLSFCEMKYGSCPNLKADRKVYW